MHWCSGALLIHCGENFWIRPRHSRPDTGDVIRGSGGIRKLRWSGKGKGKRGGFRIIYYWKSKKNEVWLLTLYAKNEAENISVSVLREIRKEIEK